MVMSEYVLADKLCIVDLQDTLMDYVQSHFEQAHSELGVAIDPEDIGWAWDITGDDSKLRRFMVDALQESLMRLGERGSSLITLGEYGSGNVDGRDDLSMKIESLMAKNGTLGFQLYSKIFDVRTGQVTECGNPLNPLTSSCRYHVHEANQVCPF